jgi:hypothetical protein
MSVNDHTTDPPTTDDLRPAVISLGAGVQSTAMALMAARGELGQVPELAVFADTGWEPQRVYEHLDWLEVELRERCGMHLIRASAGNLRDDLVDFAEGRGRRYASPPLYLKGEISDRGILRRQCTREYKVDVIRRALRAEGYGPARPVDQWIGISLDEVVRMKPSRTAWTRSVWPLIDRRITRQGCLDWLRREGYPEPGKSACIGCPYHSDAVWRELRNEHPAEWEDAVAVDRAIRSLPMLDGHAFLHAQRVPLDEVDLSTPEDLGQQRFDFQDECEGLCGV